MAPGPVRLAQHLRVYVNGQLSDLPRKSIEPMADRAGALVHSLWLTGQVRTTFLEKEAEIITETQQRNEKSQRSHVKARKRRLRKMGINCPRYAAA
jgi:hypothetical protein